MASPAFSTIPITPEEMEQYPGVDFNATEEPSNPEGEDWELLEIIPQMLARVSRFNRVELNKAVNLITKHFREQPKLPLSTEGPCLRCKTAISYLPLSGAHKRFGEEWFIKLKHEALAKGFFIDGCQKFNSGGLLLAGKQFHFFRNFLCGTCIETMRGKHRPLAHLALKQRVERDRQYDNRHAEERAQREYLRTCRYKEFLASDFWKEVRARALKRAGYKCELCASRYQVLNVHHKTYENRGYEDRNMGDLIVLCEICHGTFHGKLAAAPKEE